MSEYSHEPTRGLPGVLPQDEQILWQSSPDWKHMAMTALHIRLSVAYFAAIAIWLATQGDAASAMAVSLLGICVVGLFALFAWGVGRTTVYTLTNKRLVLRIGVALNKCINLPLSEIKSANLKMLPSGHGNIVLDLKGAPRLGYIMLWPHARSLRFVTPQPTLRAIPEARAFAALLFKTTQAVQPVAPVEATPQRSRDVPLMGVPA
ncbi:photosynthetic complex putative assembly protein PuhB [Sphingorhabdus sp.]|uniref:photosynthetic complex putative assembly protein PuhB n=1 Tax=Sphingorhabdus sp. TaxID=1902408 RepID=UPI00391AE80F